MNPGADGRITPPLNIRGASREDELGPETPVPPARVAELFAAIDKASRSQRLYQANNPVHRGFITSAQQVISRLLDELQSFTCGVEEQGFRWYGRLFPMGEGRDTLPFMFYRDGIRFITLLPGFEDEFERFLHVVNRGRAHGTSGDEDMVTLLWQEEFASFQYSYVDALAEGLDIPGSTTPQLRTIELTLVREDAGATTGERGSSPHGAGDSADDARPVSSRHDFEETLYFLDDEELGILRQEVELEWARDAKTAVLDALFDRLEDGDPAWSGEIIRILHQLLPSFLGAGDMGSAAHLLMELGGVIGSGRLDEATLAEARAFLEELSEPAVLSQLLASLEDGSIDPTSAELGVFLRHLGPAAMPVLLSAAEHTDEGPLQLLLRSALESLASAHRQKLLTLLRASDPDVMRGAARLCGRLGVAQSAPLLAELLSRAEPTTRRVIVEALVGIRNSPALDAVQGALVDADRDVRIAAARGLAGLRYAPARTRLEELLDSAIVRDADLTEKIAFFEAYGSVADAESVAMLDRMLNGRKLFGKASPEIRACAAMALGRVRTPAARSALQKAADSSHPIVRNAVLQALRQEVS